MLSGKEMNVVYEMLSVFPLDENVKVSFNVSRKIALLMAKTMELGTLRRDDQPGLFSIADEATLEMLRKIPGDILAKAGLTNLNEKLITLSNK